MRLGAAAGRAGAGGDGEPDRDGVWTGSVIRAGEQLHIFYTGHTLDGEIPQSVCHATSPDGDRLGQGPRATRSRCPTRRVSRAKDWRDPFVFWNERERCYWMLLSARSAAHPAVSRGVVAVQTSADLVSWSAAEELYETFLTHCPECPEVFELDGHWVLGYSRFTDRRGTVYRVADDPRGPWHHLATEGPDGTNWYAAKSLTDATGRRIAFGWVPDRNPAPVGGPPGTGCGAATWRSRGNCGSTPGGQLAMQVPAELHREPGRRAAHSRLRRAAGEWGSAGPGGPRDRSWLAAGHGHGRFGYCMLRPAQASAGEYVVSVTVRGGTAARPSSGVAVQTNEQLDCGVAVLCYPSERPGVRGRPHRAAVGGRQRVREGDHEYASVAEGACRCAPSTTITIRVIVRGDVVEAFVADTVCLTYRLLGCVRRGRSRFVHPGWVAPGSRDVRGQLVGHVE